MEKQRLPDKDTQCACGCGLYTHLLSPGGHGTIYKSGHEPASKKEGGEWVRLQVGEIMRAGDRVNGANGDELTPDSVGVGTPVNQYVAIYRRK